MNVYFWNAENMKALIGYLFNKDTGILAGKRIFIFLGTFAMLSWGFISYLKMGEGNSNKLPYVIALIIAAFMTHNGVTSNMAIYIGEVVAFLIIGKQLSGEFNTKWVGWLFALAIVLVTSYAVFGGHAIPFAGGSGTSKAAVSGHAGGISLGGWGAGALLFVLAIVIFFISMWIFGRMNLNSVGLLILAGILLLIIAYLVWSIGGGSP